ncbi:MAG: sigma-70 family RNA polymerase sigma factor [Actinobacteria bacterium]|nr:sigma-70 family RNA polymerase sigma factor [Actinomycetota bacterium]MCB9411695.1 sigma-70 family RNA polymerase sigma factor [Actinomycetota bacterium]
MLTDGRELVARVARDSDTALSALTEKFGQMVFDYCAAVLADPELAGDAAAGTLMAATQRISELSDPQELDAWLCSLARGECLLLLQTTPERTRNGSDAGSAVAESSADVALVRSALASLSAGDRGVLTLARGSGFAVAEIAAIMGVTQANARARLDRANENLSQAVETQLLQSDPPGSCTGLDALLADAVGAPPAGMRRLVTAHIADCPSCEQRVADVRWLYADAESRPAAFGSGVDAVAAIQSRLSGAVQPTPQRERRRA